MAPAGTNRRDEAPPLGLVAPRLLVPAWLLVIAGLQMSDGTTDMLPVWIDGLAQRFEIDRILALRVLIGLELLGAGLMLLIGAWARALAIVAMAAACFSAIASISAAPEQRTTVLLGLLVLAVSAILFAICLRRAAPRPTTLSLQWQAIGALAVAIVATTIAAQLSLRSDDLDIRAQWRPVRPAEAVEFDFADLVGQAMASSRLRSLLPDLTARTLEGRVVTVFYNPRCGMCHDLFADLSAEAIGPDTSVIAVLVPPPPDASLLESDQPEEIDCPHCLRLELPPDRIYLVTPPMIVVTEEGVITCVSEREGGECLARILAGS